MVENLDLADLSLSLNAAGFGPVSGIKWDNFDGKIYQPYNKRERIGKISDFVTVAAQQAMAQANMTTAQQQLPQMKTKQMAAAQASQQQMQQNEMVDEDDKGFEKVEKEVVTKKKQITKGGPQQYQQRQNNYYQRNNYNNTNQRGQARGGRGTGRGGRGFYSRGNDYGGYMHNFGKRGYRDPSIEIRGDWPVIEELSKNQLEKLNPVQATLSQVAKQCGELHAYNPNFDKSSCSKPLTLTQFQGQIFNHSTLEDPVIK